MNVCRRCGDPTVRPQFCASCAVPVARQLTDAGCRRCGQVGFVAIAEHGRRLAVGCPDCNPEAVDADHDQLPTTPRDLVLVERQ